MTTPHFDGDTYDFRHDHTRLSSQLDRVFEVLLGGAWHTLDELVSATGDLSHASVSARVRDLRKEKFGGWVIERRRRGNPGDGLHEYRLVLA